MIGRSGWRALKSPHLLVDPSAPRCATRGKHNESSRGVKRLSPPAIAKDSAKPEQRKPPKNRPKRLRNSPECGVTTDKILIDAKSFEVALDALRRILIRAAIGEKRAVLAQRNVRHTPLVPLEMSRGNQASYHLMLTEIRRGSGKNFLLQFATVLSRLNLSSELMLRPKRDRSSRANLRFLNTLHSDGGAIRSASAPLSSCLECSAEVR